MATYSELRLRIDRGVSQGSYRIVATGPAGEALGRFKLPFADLELENFILKVGSTRRGRRRIDSPEMEMAKSFGTKLFGALFEGDVRELYRSSFAESRADGRGLRVTLSLTGAPELLQVPWEYMYDHPSFLSISTWTPIVRYLDLPKPRRPLQIELPLRILGLVSAPSDFDAIDADQERAKLESALAPLIASGAIAIDWLEEASLRALQRQLRKADYHVFHYIGHGGYDSDADDGVLLFEDEQGRGRRVSGVQLGTILADEVSLRLAVLNSCEGARSSLQDPFSGVATSLIEREIPAVIGMQFEITDRAAIVFGGEFYAALADGLPVDSSVAEARKAIYADQNDIEWGTPVLFMRVADGRLFDVKAHPPIRPVQTDPHAEIDEMPVADAAAESAERDRADVASKQAEQESAEAAAQLERTRLAAAAAVAESQRLERERAEQDAALAAAAVDTKRIEAERLEREQLQREAEEVAERERSAVATEPAVEPAASPADATASEQLVVPVAAPARDVDHTTIAIDDAIGVRVAASVADGQTTTFLAGESSGLGAGSGDRPALARTAGRAALGSLAGLVLVWIWAYLVHPDLFTGTVEETLGWFVAEAIVTVIAITSAVTVAEGAWPFVRVPGGSAYRPVGGNRWAATAIQGAVAGATVGWLATLVLYALFMPESSQLSPEVVVLHSSLTAVGFVFAEAVLVRLFPPPTGVWVAPGTSDATRPVGANVADMPPVVPVVDSAQARAAARGAVGGVVTMLLVYIFVFLASSYYDDLGAAISPFVRDTLWMAVALTVAVSVAETLWPAVRVPGGRAYRWVGGNRWAAAAIEGAVLGATVGYVVMVIQYSSWSPLEKVGPMAVITAVSFVIAEALIEAITRRRDARQPH